MAGVREIPLTKGLLAFVDEADHAWLSQWNWHAHHSGRHIYAARNATVAEREAGSVSIIYMHSVICPAPAGLVTDHENGHSVDNRRANLRVATYVQNSVNTRVSRGALEFRGVYIAKPSGRYVARIRRKGLVKSLGTYTTVEEAARAYDAAAIEMHGEFARLNFPEAA